MRRMRKREYRELLMDPMFDTLSLATRRADRLQNERDYARNDLDRIREVLADLDSVVGERSEEEAFAEIRDILDSPT